MKKLAIIVGHTKNSPGATSYNNVKEYFFNKAVSFFMISFLKKYEDLKYEIFFRDKIGIQGVARQISEQLPECDISLELHFNSFKESVRGCEILVHEEDNNSEETIKIADLITDKLSEEYGIPQRHQRKKYNGVLLVSSKDPGASNLKYTINRGVKHCMLIEPCFANHKILDAQLIIEDPERYAKFLATTICENVFGLKEKETKVVPVPKKISLFQKISEWFKMVWNRLFHQID
jgi:hypothetical protein